VKIFLKKTEKAAQFVYIDDRMKESKMQQSLCHLQLQSVNYDAAWTRTAPKFSIEGSGYAGAR